MVIEEYREYRPRTEKLHGRAFKVIPSGTTKMFTSWKPFTITVKSGKGSHIWDLDGNELIDYCLNFSVLLLGHRNPRVIAAAREQLELGPLLGGGPRESEVELAERIARQVPCAEKVKFACTGTEAVMVALKLARAYKRKNKIGMFLGSYHGTYDSVWYQPEKGGEGALKEAASQTIMLPYNNAEAVEKAVKESKDDLAAIIVEPVGPGKSPPKGDFLKRVREITEDHEVVLIFDEVVTGLRLAQGGAQELFKVTPDICTLGKTIGGGFNLSAIVGKEEIMETLGFQKVNSLLQGPCKVLYSGTFNATPMACAAGLATLKELTPQAYERLNKTGNDIRNGITELRNDLGIKLQVTGVGSLFDIFFTDQNIIDAESTATANAVIRTYNDLSLINKGILPAVGHWCCTSAVTSDYDVKKTLKAIEKTLTELKPLIRDLAPNLI